MRTCQACVELRAPPLRRGAPGRGWGAPGLRCLALAALAPGAARLAALAGVAFTLPLCSLGEWLVHRVLYHGRVPGLGLLRRIHQQGHHVALFPPTRYVQAGPYPFMRVRAPLLPFRMAETRPRQPPHRVEPGGAARRRRRPADPAARLAADPRPRLPRRLRLTLAAVSFALAHVHGAMHTPRDRWIERRRWFRWLDRRHYVHHVDPRTNLNFMLPLCDGLFGTHRPHLTPAEATRVPPFEQAHRPRPRRARRA